MKIYLDMDGVIADFDKRAKSILGGRSLKSFATSEEGWNALGDYKYNMYLLLDPMPDAHLLVAGVFDLAKKHNSSVGVLTALPKFNRVPLSEQHKKEWLSKHFPELLQDFNTGPHAVDKQNHCKTGHVLFVDSKLTIPQWNAKGGKGILHNNAVDSLSELTQYLESMESFIS